MREPTTGFFFQCGCAFGSIFLRFFFFATAVAGGGGGVVAGGSVAFAATAAAAAAAGAYCPMVFFFWSMSRFVACSHWPCSSHTDDVSAVWMPPAVAMSPRSIA